MDSLPLECPSCIKLSHLAMASRGLVILSGNVGTELPLFILVTHSNPGAAHGGLCSSKWVYGGEGRLSTQSTDVCSPPYLLGAHS